MQQAAVELVTPAPRLAGRAQASLKKAGIDPAFGTAAFVCEESSDTYRCRAGRSLGYRRSSRKRHKQYRQYQAQGSDCRQCALRQSCRPQSFERGRRLSRAAEDPLMAAHQKWMDSEKAQAAYRGGRRWRSFPMPG